MKTICSLDSAEGLADLHSSLKVQNWSIWNVMIFRALLKGKDETYSNDAVAYVLDSLEVLCQETNSS